MLTPDPQQTVPGFASFGPFCPPQPHHHPPTPTAQPPHKPVTKASPPPTIPPRPVSSIPSPLGFCRRRGKPLTGCAADAQAVWGGHGAGRGEGETKRQNKFFFFLHPSQGGVSAGGGSPPGPLSGDHACPGALSPHPHLDPYTSCPKRAPTLPRAGGQGNQVTRRGLASPFLEGPRPLLSEGDGHLGNLSVQGSSGAEGLTEPTPPHLWGGRTGRPEPCRPCPGAAPCSELML